MAKLKIKALVSILLLVVAIFTCIMLLGRVLVPFIIASIIAYILNPLVELVHTYLKLSRTMISLLFALIVFLLLLGIVLFVIPQLMFQFTSLIDSVPHLVAVINSKVLLPINLKYNTNLIVDIDSIKALLLDNVDVLSSLAKNSLIILETIVYLILIPFVLFYAIKNWQEIIEFFASLIPRSYVNSVNLIVRDIDIMLSRYLRGQISVMIIMATYYACGLQFIDLELGIIIGIITGLLVFIPYLGVFTGFIIALSIGFANFYNLHQLLTIATVYIIGHILEGTLVTPFLIGGRIGLNPILLILALMIFGTLFGFVGVLLALPLSTIAIVLLKHARIYYTKSNYYQETV